VTREPIEHEPVLCDELMSIAAPQPGEMVVDTTIGHGGHAHLLTQAIGPAGRLIGLDVDEKNLARARRRVEAAMGTAVGPHLDLVRENFSRLEDVLDLLGVAHVDLILADLGVSTDQLLDASTGLSFTEDGLLDMRLDDRLETTASDLVNRLSERELSDLIWHSSQERFSRRIAKRICQVRREGRIKTTLQLVRIVCSALGVSLQSHRSKIHPATRTFLALRIAVNEEIESLKALLAAAANRLAPGGRIAVISFHSGEDRIVKKDFLNRRRNGAYEILTKKPINPTSEEVRRNPRSRSAKLRVARQKPSVSNAA
jgi:16S rRNA (cytosine1402-N4)-methyltransferase